ncbi:MAG: 16S rRNA (adenine(1518)-N(6)/adenine(1519)-N(6))-dimethyltransferase RsmA [Candidatus Bathyarchaeia archaeon]|nr:ribosomal RNA small subunit methyltransferase A [Candidatus Bathyarchaeota archaeon]
MNLLEETKLLLRRYRIFPKKRLGQHFTVDPSIFHRMVEYAALSSDDVVLDVGAGFGFLTRYLAAKCQRVLAVELDSKVAAILRLRLKDLPNVIVIEGDVFKVPLPPFNKVVAIPPYSISSQLIRWLFNKSFHCAILVLQKEFARRLVAPMGTEDYGWLTILTYYYLDVELLDEVPRYAFYPPPEVDSTILLLKPKHPRPFSLKNEEWFERFVRVMFTQRNRKVKNAIRAFAEKELAKGSSPISSSIPFKEKRVRELAPEDFGVLANVLAG